MGQIKVGSAEDSHFHDFRHLINPKVSKAYLKSKMAQVLCDIDRVRGLSFSVESSKFNYSKILSQIELFHTAYYASSTIRKLA